MITDKMETAILTIVFISLFAILTTSILSDRKRKETDNWAFRRNYKVPCEVITSVAYEGGIFKDRIIRTPTHRFKIHEQDDVVVGDSIGSYDFNNLINGKVIEIHSSQYGIKNKDVMLYSSSSPN